ncbi:MAG: ParB/RepB/Spo0J family partition protein [Oscillospiraceae bacterium]|nr:ParB/RepB/Spo0J family partition protein [Oscillospiraceae bacterium]
MAKKGLGKGLSTLFDDNNIIEDIAQPPNGDIIHIKLSSIEPNKNQPRKNFDNEKIEVLAESIKENGLIQPIIVTPSKNGMYKIVAGERRWRASKKAGLKEIPAVIRDYSDEQVAEIALIENLQREDLNPIEEALGYKALLEDFNLTQELISRRIGKSRSAIANSMRLLSLEEQIQKLLVSGDISGGHARAILSLDDNELRLALSKKIIEDGLTVRQAEALSKQLKKKAPAKKPQEKTAYEIEIEHIQNKLSSDLGTKVKILHTDKKGKIEIEYYGNEDLERILNLINYNGGK